MPLVLCEFASACSFTPHNQCAIQHVAVTFRIDLSLPTRYANSSTCQRQISRMMRCPSGLLDRVPWV